jgi:hypothetical protein
MNSYINGQVQRIGLYVKNNEPLNEYPDAVKLKLHHVNGETNWLSLSNTQLSAIFNILSSEGAE